MSVPKMGFEKGTFPDVHEEFRRGFQCHKSGLLREAEEIYRGILCRHPAHHGALHLLGLLAYDAGKKQEAIHLISEAVRHDPSNPVYYSNLGNAYRSVGRLQEALDCLKRALEKNPNAAVAYFNLGEVFAEQNRLDQSIFCYRKTLALAPHFSGVYPQLYQSLQKTCSWKEMDELRPALDRLTEQALRSGAKPDEYPWTSMMRDMDPQRNLAVARAWSDHAAERATRSGLRFPPDGRRGKHGKKITLGYVSDHFRNHPGAHLVAGLFGRHDRTRFDVFGYSLHRDDGSRYREKIAAGCSRFVDLSASSPAEAAKRIYVDGVDILIDLTGYSGGYDLSIPAHRPSPVQVTWLGSPGTTGAGFMDYIITDETVTPPEHEGFYREKLVYVPHCYQVTDDSQAIPEKVRKREEAGLSEGVFVFCCFNGPVKIDRAVYHAWVEILRATPWSLLWLLEGSPTACRNLKREAACLGLDPERILFAKPAPREEHLARLRLADLALDTFICNGHTTTSDALWSGVPVLTLQGPHFASRVASSILKAVGLEDLITASVEEYRGLAVRLARDRDRMDALRRRLVENRNISPLFDTGRFARNLEAAYAEMWEIFRSGEKPRPIRVTESGRMKSLCPSKAQFSSLRPMSNAQAL